MLFEKELLFLRHTLKRNNIQVLVINSNDLLDERFDYSMQHLFFNNDYSKRFCDFFGELSSKTIYKVDSGFLLHYIFISLPETENEVLIIGPYILRDISRHQVIEQAEKFSLPPKDLIRLEQFYSTIPIIRDETMLFSLINSFCDILWGFDGFSVTEINKTDLLSLQSIIKNDETSTQDDTIWSVEIMEKRYEYEQELMNAVSVGNRHKAEAMMSRFSSLAFENRVSDPLRNTKNYCIIMNTLLRKAAQNGGVHPLYIDRVSSDFAKKIENLSSPKAAEQFMLEIMKSYCKLVKKHSINKFSPLIQRSIIKIEEDLSADLSLKELALLNDVSPSYLSALFKKETGQTLTDFVNSRRMNHAMHLLKTTHLQIQTIAQYCGIFDLHYFSRLFKKYVGVTPKEYREHSLFS